MAVREFTVIVEQDEDGILVGSVPELRGCHTQATSLDLLMERMRAAIELYLKDHDDEIESHVVGIHRIAV